MVNSTVKGNRPPIDSVSKSADLMWHNQRRSMKSSASKSPKKEPMTARELLEQKVQDPEHLASVEKRKQEIEAAVRENRKVEVPIVKELRNAGYNVDSVWGLIGLFRTTRSRYVEAVPILLRWLPRISNTDVKDTIVRVLSVPWAKEASPTLIAEFKLAPNPPSGKTSWKWAIGNAIEVLADDEVFADISEIALDRQYARDREMFALALAKMRKHKDEAIDALIRLLDDEDVAGHAVLALGKLRAKKAAPHLERFTSHPKTWVRKEAKKALGRIQSAQR